MSASDDELDDILDSALDAFKLEESKPASSSTAAAAQASEKQHDDEKEPPPPTPAGNGDSASDKEKVPTTQAVDEAMRAFQEALGAPLPSAADLGADGDLGDEEADMKLVEDFMRGLETLNSDAAAKDGHTPAVAESFVKSLLEDMLSKEVLAEPIGQVRDALAKALDEGEFEAADRTRHVEQLRVATALCDEFKGEARPEKVVDLLAQLKDSGDLPSGVAADLPEPGDEAEQLAALGSSCPMQ